MLEDLFKVVKSRLDYDDKSPNNVKSCLLYTSGQIAGMIKEIRPCQEILDSIFSDAEKRIMEKSKLF